MGFFVKTIIQTAGDTVDFILKICRIILLLILPCRNVVARQINAGDSTGTGEKETITHARLNHVLTDSARIKINAPIKNRVIFWNNPSELFDKHSFEISNKFIFKYDTSRENPELRCYEFKKPLTHGYLFLFNLLSNQKYNMADPH